MKILMISTDRKIIESESAVKLRMLSYASKVDELFIVVLGVNFGLRIEGKLRYIGITRLKALFWQSPKGFDLVTSQDPFETGAIARRLAKILGAKLELQIHTDVSSRYFQQESFKNRIRFLSAKRLLPKADHIRVVSDRIKIYLVEKLKINNSKIEVRPIPVDVEKIKNTSITVDLHKKYPQFDKIILMASRLTKEKNVGLAIEAMCEVIKQKPKTGLVIVGSGPEEKKLKFLASSFQLLSNTIFEKWIDQKTLFSYYKTVDLFLVTSRYEGYGMTLVEAKAAGCKIVSTDVGAVREIRATIVDQNFSSVAQAIVESLK